MNSNHTISDIEIKLNESASVFESIVNNLEIWKEKVYTKKQFSKDWQEYVIQARKLIQKMDQILENFFPKLSSDSANSTQMAEFYQSSLDQFMPTIKVKLLTFKIIISNNVTLIHFYLELYY